MVKLGGKRRTRMPAGQARDKRVTIYLNDAEEARLRGLCETFGSTPGRVVMAAIDSRQDSFDRLDLAQRLAGELMVTNRQLVGAAANLNQIAHGVNISGEFDGVQAARLAAEVEQVCVKVRAVLAEAFG